MQVRISADMAADMWVLYYSLWQQPTDKLTYMKILYYSLWHQPTDEMTYM